MLEPLKVAIIGTGAVARLAHIPAFQRLGSRVQIVALCDKNLEAAVSTSKAFSIPNSYSDVKEMLESETIDIVDVCTPPQTHYNLVMMSLEKGLHTLIEKPMAMTGEECDSIIASARRKGVKLSVVHNNLFHPAFRSLNLQSKQGALGDLLSVNVSLSEPRSHMISLKNHWVHKLPGGVLMETGPHAVYMALALLGVPEEIQVFGHSNLHLPWAPFDELRIFLSFKNALSSISLSYSGIRWAATVEAIGSAGSVEADLRGYWTIRYSSKSQGRIQQFADSLKAGFTILKGTSTAALRSISGMARYGHDMIIDEFVKSVSEDKPEPVAPEEARDTIVVLNAIISKLEKANYVKAG